MPHRKKYKDETIDVFSKTDVETWCEVLECSRVELVFAVLNAGKMADDVNDFINKQRAALKNKNESTEKSMKDKQFKKNRNNEKKI